MAKSILSFKIDLAITYRRVTDTQSVNQPPRQLRRRSKQVRAMNICAAQ